MALGSVRDQGPQPVGGPDLDGLAAQRLALRRTETGETLSPDLTDLWFETVFEHDRNLDLVAPAFEVVVDHQDHVILPGIGFILAQMRDKLDRLGPEIADRDHLCLFNKSVIIDRQMQLGFRGKGQEQGNSDGETGNGPRHGKPPGADCTRAKMRNRPGPPLEDRDGPGEREISGGSESDYD